LLQGTGGNILVNRGPDGLLIIDDDYSKASGALKQEIEKLGDLNQIKYIINTHWHGDHSGGNAALGKYAPIVAQENVRTRLSSRQQVPIFNMVSDPYPEYARPTLTYPDAMTIVFNGDSVFLQHYPNGHTDGDSVIFFNNASLIHMGDHMFYPMFPFVDIGSGGNAISYANNVAAILAKADEDSIIIPGHGPVTDRAGLARFSEMLKGTIAEVTAMKAQGLSLQQAQQQGLDKKWQQWNGGFIKEPTWIEFIYQSL
jgi:glyoxylase-like metal-dependent hydrolase (beta-lactamase superfamily II)